MPVKTIADKWEKVRNTPGLYSKPRADGTLWLRWRTPGDPKRGWTSIVVDNIRDGKTQFHKTLAAPVARRKKPASAVKFLEYAEKWIENHPAANEKTKEGYRSSLRTWLKPLHTLKMREIDGDSIKFIIEAMQAKPLASETQKGHIACLSAILKTAFEDEDIITNPLDRVSARYRPRGSRKAKRILTPDEAARFIECSRETSGGDLRALMALLLFAGPRISEAVGLGWGDVDLKDNKIHFWRQLARNSKEATIDGLWTPLKSQAQSFNPKDRRVEVSEILRGYLVEHRGDYIRHPNDFVFLNSQANPLTPNRVSVLIKEIAEEAGISGQPELTAHQFRHNFASALIASGNDVGFVSDQLGHSSPLVTLGVYRTEFTAAREKGSGARAIDAIYGEAMSRL